MLGASMINDMANAKSVQSPSWMLQSLRHNIVAALGQTSIDEDSHDGMDIAFCTFDTNSGILTYAGANIPIIISSKNEISPSDRILTHHDGLVELKPDRMPIALYDKMDSFSEIQVKLAPDDTVYLFTDGYVDQFGGQKNKKFGHEAFRALISSVKDLNFSEQKQIIWSTIERWKGETENQTDDILVMGLKLSQQIGKKV
jgi:serine phosphatase RsbU (regulator of sigma subunit)